ncbi:hypothetical protein Tco_0299169 [Tanacetum coccineum]
MPSSCPPLPPLSPPPMGLCGDYEYNILGNISNTLVLRDTEYSDLAVYGIFWSLCLRGACEVIAINTPYLSLDGYRRY